MRHIQTNPHPHQSTHTHEVTTQHHQDELTAPRPPLNAQHPAINFRTSKMLCVHLTKHRVDFVASFRRGRKNQSCRTRSHYNRRLSNVADNISNRLIFVTWRLGAGSVAATFLSRSRPINKWTRCTCGRCFTSALSG